MWQLGGGVLRLHSTVPHKCQSKCGFDENSRETKDIWPGTNYRNYEYGFRREYGFRQFMAGGGGEGYEKGQQ